MLSRNRLKLLARLDDLRLPPRARQRLAAQVQDGQSVVGIAPLPTLHVPCLTCSLATSLGRFVIRLSLLLVTLAGCSSLPLVRVGVEFVSP